jgi:DNA-binding MarR family transcriptional regulator
MSEPNADRTAAPDGETQRLRAWLRMLKATRKVEARLRERLRTEFGSTLPRFDVMAALDRFEGGLRMSELSAALRVSNGNVTGIVERLVADGAVLRVPVVGDKRATLVRLTRKGKGEFAAMAAAHRTWIGELFGRLSADACGDLIATMAVIGDRPAAGGVEDADD